ncbi:MAG: prolipoprotein diacylglyceryl transferase [Actinomycetia bacterium]|nr:prolipoprotein diacylglyceryl transferase [Actinomycetes bacterium]
MTSVLAIPSPSDGVWYIGSFPLRGYAVAIIAGIFLAIWIGDRRWRARGGDRGVVADVAVWAVPFGIIGGRLYHVISSPAAYFGSDGNPVDALRIWEGGLGIWGAVVLGGVGAWIGVRRRGIPLPPFGDAIAPGIAVAQAVGRWGNWLNQELFGKPTSLPWGLEIDLEHRPVEYLDVGPFHPTFLYESIWMLTVAGILVLVDRRWRLGHGRVFALYVALYALGRLPIELLRIDAANEILGVRVNVWVSIVVFAGAIAYLVVSARRAPGREAPDELLGTEQRRDAT